MQKREAKLYIIVLVILIIITVLLYFVILDIKNRERFLTVAFLDVGQGDAIYIEGPNRNQILVDAGSGRQILSELGKVMPFFDRSLNAIVSTHPDKDHIGGFESVLDKYKVDEYFFSDVSSDTETYASLMEKVREKSLPEKILKASDKIYLDTNKNIYLEILHPDTTFNSSESNDMSLVIKLVYNQSEYILTGDASIEVESILRDKYVNNLDIDVLKIGHHGSNTSTSKEFVGYTSPEIGIISAGDDNQYGHPHKEVVDTLTEFNVKILETTNLGTIVTKSDGESVWVD